MVLVFVVLGVEGQVEVRGDRVRESGDEEEGDAVARREEGGPRGHKRVLSCDVSTWKSLSDHRGVEKNASTLRETSKRDERPPRVAVGTPLEERLRILS